MLGKTQILFAVGIISLFTGVVYTIVNATGSMITEQTRLMDARLKNRIGAEEYRERTRETEMLYRGKVAAALEKIESKFKEAIGVVGRLSKLGEGYHGSEEPRFKLVEQEVNVTVLDDGEVVVFLNGTPYPVEDLELNFTEDNKVLVKVVVIEENRVYHYYPYMPGNMTELLNLTGKGNYTAELEAVAGNLSQGIERLRTETVS